MNGPDPTRSDLSESQSYLTGFKIQHIPSAEKIKPFPDIFVSQKMAFLARILCCVSPGSGVNGNILPGDSRLVSILRLFVSAEMLSGEFLYNICRAIIFYLKEIKSILTNLNLNLSQFKVCP
jgi:hypothetical protein